MPKSRTERRTTVLSDPNRAELKQKVLDFFTLEENIDIYYRTSYRTEFFDNVGGEYVFLITYWVDL